MRTRSTMHSRVKSRSCDNYLSIKVSAGIVTVLLHKKMSLRTACRVIRINSAQAMNKNTFVTLNKVNVK